MADKSNTYAKGPFDGPDLSPSTSVESLRQPLATLAVQSDPGRKRLSDLQFDKLVRARLEHAAAKSRGSTSEKLPELVESSGHQPRRGVLEDIFLGATGTPKDSISSACLVDRVKADAQFSELSSMIETVLGQTSMTIIRRYIDTRPPDEQGELCELMVREIMREILLLSQRSASPDPFSQAEQIEGQTIRAAMEILVEKDSSVDLENDTQFTDLLLQLEIFRRKYGIDL